MTQNSFCCSTLKGMIDDGGRKGFSIVPFKNTLVEDEYVYFFQSRSTDFDDKTGRHITIDVAIQYCPWCGTKLTEVTKSNKDEIISIAARNKGLIDIK